jgi:hypothetical protein
MKWPSTRAMRLGGWLLLPFVLLGSMSCDRGAGGGDAASDAVGPSDCPVFIAPGKLPASVEEAKTRRLQGASWSNKEIRARYVCWVTGIGAMNVEWKAQGLPAQERARKAFEVRHDARMISRAMMASDVEVKLLQERDREKYGNPDGPTFEWLVEKAGEKGLSGDAVYDEIVSSAQRTDAATNKAFGL